MNRLFPMAAGLLLASTPAGAFWQSRNSHFNKLVVAGSGYAGPGDVKPGANPWCGLRAYSGAAAAGGAKAIRIRRASDNLEQDFVVLSNGQLDTTSINTFINATTGFISKCYDQSGNANDIPQATAANQCKYVAAGVNGVSPAFQCQYGGADQYIGPGTITSSAQPTSFVSVSNLQTFTGGVTFPNLLRNSNQFCGVNSSANPYVYETNTFASATTVVAATWYAIGCTVNGSGNSSVAVNGSTQTGGTLDGAATGTLIQLNEGFANIYAVEGGQWVSTAFSGTDHTNVAHNACVFWGFGGPC